MAPESQMKRQTAFNLEQAIESIYRTFAVDPPSLIDGCPCCIEKRGVDVLLVTPLKSLRGENLWSYVAGLFYTVGSVADYRYLLPRILELAALSPGESNNPEIVLRKLALADWSKWTTLEQDTIFEFVMAWFEHSLERDMNLAFEGFNEANCESIICGAALAGMQLEPFVARLRRLDVREVKAVIEKRLIANEQSAFWNDFPDLLREFRTLMSH